MLSRLEDFEAEARAIAALPLEQQAKKLEELLARVALSDPKIAEATVQKLLAPQSWMTGEQRQWHTDEVIRKMSEQLRKLLPTYVELEKAREHFALLKAEGSARKHVVLKFFTKQGGRADRGWVDANEEIAGKAELVNPAINLHTTENFKGVSYTLQTPGIPNDTLIRVTLEKHDIVDIRDALDLRAKGPPLDDEAHASKDFKIIFEDNADVEILNTFIVKKGGKPTEKNTEKEKKDLEKAEDRLDELAKERGEEQSAGWEMPEDVLRTLGKLNDTAKKELANERRVREVMGERYDDLRTAQDHLDKLVRSQAKDAPIDLKEEALFLTNKEGLSKEGKASAALIIYALTKIRERRA